MVDNSEMIFGVRAVIEAIQAGKEIDKRRWASRTAR